jgi:peptide-methionine (S)-S-oxide reductase
MKKTALYIAILLLINGCANGPAGSPTDRFATVPKPVAGEAVATFGGGCFWSMSEALSELKGVNKVVSGYAGGTTKNPGYHEVGSQTTGHAEAAQVYYNPKVISFATLAAAFFSAHDPTTVNRQGPDQGTDYRSIAFYRNDAEMKILIATIKKVNTSKHYPGPVVTQVVPFEAFYPAEQYHQNYYRQNMNNPYIASVSQPKVLKFRKAMKAELKPEFQK